MTSDETAFLKAISDNPADETARLVYADWLADRNDPRAEFARLSAEFLRCVRGLADLRRAQPAEWLELVDPFFSRVYIITLANVGEGIEGGTVTAVSVSAGSTVARGELLLEVSTDKATIGVSAVDSGIIISVLVRPGDRIPVGHPLVIYLRFEVQQPSVEVTAPIPRLPTPPVPHPPHVPREPLAAFIRSLENRRESLRSATPEQIDALLARQMVAADMVFGGAAVRQAWRAAETNLGFGFFRTAVLREQLVSLLQQRGITVEQMPQIHLDIHIEMFRVLLQRHGQPDRVHELPDDAPPAGE